MRPATESGRDLSYDPDRHTSEDELVRAHLHPANQAVSELARRLPSHVNHDDLSSAAMLGLAQAARSCDPDPRRPPGRATRLGLGQPPGPLPGPAAPAGR
jgi:DNA-directed RNA polymerase specialized sigma subunit